MNSITVTVTLVCAALGFGIVSNVMSNGRNHRKFPGASEAEPKSEHHHDKATRDTGNGPGADTSSSEWRKPTPDGWESVLGVGKSASASEIRAAYLRLIQQYHPDRFGAAAPEIAEYGVEKTKAINAAYLIAQRLGRA